MHDGKARTKSSAIPQSSDDEVYDIFVIEQYQFRGMCMAILLTDETILKKAI
jgi:predicted acetyltransferase